MRRSAGKWPVATCRQAVLVGTGGGHSPADQQLVLRPPEVPPALVPAPPESMAPPPDAGRAATLVQGAVDTLGKNTPEVAMGAPGVVFFPTQQFARGFSFGHGPADGLIR